MKNINEKILKAVEILFIVDYYPLFKIPSLYEIKEIYTLAQFVSILTPLNFKNY